MLCSKCGKNEAMVYFSKTVNGDKTEYNLCHECADKMGIHNSFNTHRKYILNNFFAPSLLGSVDTFFANPFKMFESFFDEGTFGESAKLSDSHSCPYCGGTFENYEKTGKFGCAMCYETFKDKLDSVNVTKESPTQENELSVDKKIEVLRKKLNDAIKSERYEDAAKFRDEIKDMQSGK